MFAVRWDGNSPFIIMPTEGANVARTFSVAGQIGTLICQTQREILAALTPGLFHFLSCISPTLFTVHLNVNRIGLQYSMIKVLHLPLFAVRYVLTVHRLSILPTHYPNITLRLMTLLPKFVTYCVLTTRWSGYCQVNNYVFSKQRICWFQGLTCTQ